MVDKTLTLRMPPPDSGKSLPPAQLDLIRKWSRKGAKWEQHGSFIPPKIPPVPSVKLKGWAANPIDSFILSKLEKVGLKPSPSAPRETLIRRVTLELTGLPPSLEEIESFL